MAVIEEAMLPLDAPTPAPLRAVSLDDPDDLFDLVEQIVRLEPEAGRRVGLEALVAAVQLPNPTHRTIRCAAVARFCQMVTGHYPRPN